MPMELTKCMEQRKEGTCFINANIMYITFAYRRKQDFKERRNVNMRRKGFACLVSICMILAFIPGLVFAAGQTTSGKLIILDRQFEIAPDITEREYVTNNSELTAQQSGHVMEVKLGDNAQIIAGYNDYSIDTIKSGSNWGMRKTTEQAQDAETRRGVNVVGAVNGDFFDMSNGRPRGVLVMNSTVIQKSAYPCFYIDSDNVPHIAESSANLPDNVKEAVGGAVILVSDGKAVNTSDTSTNPRTCIGIKADNTVVIYMVDGRQAPLSVGMNYEELAQTMIDLGCVTALNLDGGGSSTFATQRAGDVVQAGDKQAGLTLRCSPSDGYERTVSSSLLVVSTATSDGEFAKAIISPNNEVYTPGSEIKFTAIGVDKSGKTVDLPEGLTWKVNDTGLGTINNGGTFTGKDKATGKVTVFLMNGDKEVGRTSVELKWPDKLGFTNSSVSLDFGETSNLSFNPTYEGREVHYKDGDFEWSLSDNALGKFVGNIFEATKAASLRGNAVVRANGVSGEVEIIVGMEPYVLMDFEDKIGADGDVIETAENYWKIHIGNATNNMLTEEQVKASRLWIRAVAGSVNSFEAELVSSTEKTPARFGRYSLKMSFDFPSNKKESTSVAEFGFAGDTLIDIVKPNKIGMWINIPEEYAYSDYELKAIIKGNAYTTADKTAYRKYDQNYNENLSTGGLNGTTKYVNYYSYNPDGTIKGRTFEDWAGKGWIWVECDISEMQMPIDMCRAYTVRIVAAQNVEKKAGYIYIDNLQFIYGTNTNDINNPVIDSVVEKASGTELKTAVKPEFESSKPVFDIGMSDSENVDKYATGIDVNGVKVSIDGRDCTSEAEVSAKNILFQTQQLTNGEHSIKIRVKDYYGNETVETYSFTVNDEAAAVAAVNVVPQGDSAEIGENFTLNINNVRNLVAEYVDSASVTIEVSESYGNAVKDDLSKYITYGSMYEQSAEPVYSDGKITITAKKKTTGGENGTIASISFPIPDSARNGDSFSYSVQGSYVISGGGAEYTFSQGQQTVSLSAEYNITAGQAIKGYPVAFKITDKDGTPVTKDITIYNGETKITNPYTFNTAGRTTVYAVDSDGKRSWNTDIVVSSLGTDGGGSPYGIQNNGSKDGSTMRNLTWLSAINGSADKAVVKYGTAEGELNITKNGDSRLFTFVQTNSGDAYRLNSVSLSELKPATTYYYQVGDGEKWSDVMSFTTASANSDADTKFFIFGDIQTSSTANLADAINKVNGNGYDFGIQTGDAIDNVTVFGNWRGYLNEVNSSKLGSTDLIHTLGNHEYYGDASGEVSKGMFGLGNSGAGSYNSYEYGSVYVGVVNNGGDILAALEQAKEDISKTKCAWKALVMHEPVYGTESLVEESKRVQVVKAIEEAGFDVVFSGDDHTYTRTYPMKSDSTLDEGGREGVVYYICGDLSGKDNEYQNQDMFAKMIPHNEYQGMYMSVEASKEKLVLTAYKHSGELLDSYTIAKTDCELGKHSFDENSIYNIEGKTIKCNICSNVIAAADSGYTGKVKAGKGEVMLVNGVAKTGWFTLIQDICHAGEDGIIHNYTTEDTATCVENGYLKSTCKCGAVYKGSSTWSKGHTWNDAYVCTVCGTEGRNIENVEFDVTGKYWEYTGTAIRAAITAKDGDYTLSASSSRYGKDAYKSYSNNVNVGKGTVTFEGRGNYYGSKSVEFPIVPKSVKEITAGTVYSTSATVKWDEAAGAGYYRVYMRTSNSGWSKVAVTENTSVVIDNLTPNTKYIFLVASSTDVDGETYNCMKWSNELSITTPARDPNTAAAQIDSIKAKVGSGDINEVVKNGEHYIMLPASADLTELNLVLDLKANYSEVIYSGAADELNADTDAVIDVTKLTGENSGNSFDIKIAMKGCEPMTLHILKSQSISSIHITSDDAAAQGRKYVDAVKGNTAKGKMVMTGADGSDIYNGVLKQIKARGNSTFQYYDKKSYQIKLETGTDLLGKNEAVKTWVLLAGYGDATQMHDKLFKDMAAALDMNYVANCNWVDLYYDGEYRGIYLLSEKNSVGSTGVDITDMEAAYADRNKNYGSDMKAEKALNDYGQEYSYIADLVEPDNITGGYLIERNLETIDEICGFYTRQGSGFNVKSPEFAGKEAMKYISEYYQEFEDAVYSENGYNSETGKYYYDYCDADSLVKVYLLQKLAYNVDGFRSSFYFYKDKNGKMYAGPVWDQEMTLGTGWDAVISAENVTYNYLEKALIKIPDFKQRVEECYKSEFKNKILSLLGDDGIVAGYYNTVSSSAEMNYILWSYVRIGYPKADGHLWADGTTYKDVVKDMTDWITVRAEKLDELYGDGTLHLSHKYVAEITKQATYDEDGVRTYTCSVCGDSYTEAISKLIRPSGGGSLINPDSEIGKTDKAENVEIRTEVEVKKTETGKTEAKAEISEKEGAALVNDAASNGAKEAVINATTRDGSSEAAEVTLQVKTLNDFVEKTDTSLVVKTDIGQVTLDNKTLETLASEAEADTVKIVVNENTQLKAEQKPAADVIGDKGMIFDLYAMAGNKQIHDFKGGKAHVNIPVPEKLKGRDIAVIYISDKGICEILNHTMETVGADKYIKFTTTHFSTFAVVDRADADKLIQQQNLDKVKTLVKEVKLKATTSKTSKKNVKVKVAEADKTNSLIKEIESMGYTVKYRFCRSAKASSSYVGKTTKTAVSWTNTSGKKGTKYYYKAKVYVYDGDNLIAKTALKQCKYSIRIWSKK